MSSHILELLNIAKTMITYHLRKEACVIIEGKTYSSRVLIDEINNIQTDSTYPYGDVVENKNDGFQGKVIGHYVTLENERGVVVQQFGTKIVHVYREKWVNPIENK